MIVLIILGIVMVAMGVVAALYYNAIRNTKSYVAEKKMSSAVIVLFGGGMGILCVSAGNVASIFIGILLIAGMIWLAVYQLKSIQGKTDEEAREADAAANSMIGFYVKDRMYDSASNQIIYQMVTGKTVNDDTIFKDYIYRSMVECFSVEQVYSIDERIIGQYEPEGMMDYYYTECYELSKVPANLFRQEGAIAQKLYKKIIEVQ